jgi:orotate phosphoribosyltransferase
VRDFFIVRKDRKDHGTRKWIEGCVGESDRDRRRRRDERRLRAQGDRPLPRGGLAIVHVAVLVDREEGGMEAIRARVPGVPVTACSSARSSTALRAPKS